MSPLNITQPLGIWSIMATIRWCPIAPKMDIYQSLINQSIDGEYLQLPKHLGKSLEVQEVSHVGIVRMFFRHNCHILRNKRTWSGWTWSWQPNKGIGIYWDIHWIQWHVVLSNPIFSRYYFTSDDFPIWMSGVKHMASLMWNPGYRALDP